MTEQQLPTVPSLQPSGALPPVRNEVLDRLVAALEASFILPDPITLCQMLDVSGETSTQVILLQWICRVLLEMDEAQAAQRLPDIVHRLDRALNAGDLC
ncbi:hypothetical protein [Acidithiobacillus sulfurivorans]|uniref:Acyl carrier protein n=1 Tax=Acidithiobacillus sulfurivorans TaxID=1958756 RepID=A0ABS5ZTZ4_9PROT|nr:hypothetical protein [Acidithiobacillus sulfurivorans]MBU2758681.1 hypothetical protein [Acidithiobacillus sulfurivorans]